MRIPPCCFTGSVLATLAVGLRLEISVRWTGRTAVWSTSLMSSDEVSNQLPLIRDLRCPNLFQSAQTAQGSERIGASGQLLPTPRSFAAPSMLLLWRNESPKNHKTLNGQIPEFGLCVCQSRRGHRSLLGLSEVPDNQKRLIGSLCAEELVRNFSVAEPIISIDHIPYPWRDYVMACIRPSSFTILDSPLQIQGRSQIF